ncbi:MAG: hypothetical protein B7Z20_08500, partial [Sphingobium sp. 32-64-5]
MTDQTTRIAELNDRCRLGHDPTARIVITATCLAALADGADCGAEMAAQAAVMAAVRRYCFGPEDGAERARGELTIRQQPIRFVIDYYDRSLEWGSENPADPSVT